MADLSEVILAYIKNLINMNTSEKLALKNFFYLEKIAPILMNSCIEDRMYSSVRGS